MGGGNKCRVGTATQMSPGLQAPALPKRKGKEEKEKKGERVEHE